LKSSNIAKEIEEKYVRAAMKLRTELAALNCGDNMWHLRSWDEVVVVKLYCGECKKGFGGEIGDHSKQAIHNLFNNFKVSHVTSTLHAKAYCKRKGVSYDNHPQDKARKAIVLTAMDYKALVEEGIGIIGSVNDSITSSNGTFVSIGDVHTEHMKSFWFKVRCTVCGELFMLCPAKKNLQCNLENHVNGLKHVKVVEVAQAKSTSSALSTGERGRPTTAQRGLQGNYNSLHAWFKLIGRGGKSGSSSDASGQCDSILSLLCWGYWGKIAMYSNNVYDISSLVHDPHHKGNWYPECATKARFTVGDELFNISGSF
jgi:hypothetical protein